LHLSAGCRKAGLLMIAQAAAPFAQHSSSHCGTLAGAASAASGHHPSSLVCNSVTAGVLASHSRSPCHYAASCSGWGATSSQHACRTKAFMHGAHRRPTTVSVRYAMTLATTCTAALLLGFATAVDRSCRALLMCTPIATTAGNIACACRKHAARTHRMCNPVE
jgi:hypothetical protein